MLTRRQVVMLYSLAILRSIYLPGSLLLYVQAVELEFPVHVLWSRLSQDNPCYYPTLCAFSFFLFLPYCSHTVLSSCLKNLDLNFLYNLLLTVTNRQYKRVSCECRTLLLLPRSLLHYNDC